ncbi:hypothetical protein ACSLOE_30900, partial [Escherichia coli]
KRLLIKCSFQPDILPTVRVCNADTASHHPDHFKPCLCERLNQTARKVNSGQWSSGDRVQVLAALMAIGEELRRLRLAVREQ